MFTICPRCGQSSPPKEVDPRGPLAICPFCGHGHRFVRLPLFMVVGASGAGKSTLALALPLSLPECVTLDMDILWGAVPATPDDNYRGYFNTWLNLALNIAQSGRPVVLLGSATPDVLESCTQRRYFTQVHYLALIPTDEVLAQRLRSRPSWRRAGTPEFIAEMLAVNQRLRATASTATPPMSVLDTGSRSAAESVAAVARWVRLHLPQSLEE